MKKTFTHYFAALLLLAAGLLAAETVQAQDDTILGYAKVNITVKTAMAGSGKVFPSAKEATVKAWREEWSFTQAVAVGGMMGEYIASFYLYAQPADTYIFAGWYLDDGDGVFDVEKDEFINDDEMSYYMTMLPEGTTVYDTEAAAKSAPAPSQPSELVWAYFTRGASVGLSRYQGSEYSHYANCGTVWISKPLNEPGDELTVEAIPNDGFHFAFWQDAEELGNIVSRENPYTFTVAGGERIYAYFEADDAPVVQLPEEGGFAVLNTNEAWFLSDESAKNGAHVLVMMADDLRRDADGRAYLDMNLEDCQIDVAQKYEPTIVYGKGEVRFSIHLVNINFARSYNDLVQWSGTKGVSIKGDVIYVYVFVPELGAFIKYGTTDDFDPDYTETVSVPAGVAYFQMSAFDLTDDDGNIPSVIGFSPETYDAGVAGGQSALDKFLAEVAGIGDIRMADQTIRGHKVYTLSGVEVKTTQERGVYIVNGRKVVVK